MQVQNHRLGSRATVGAQTIGVKVKAALSICVSEWRQADAHDEGRFASSHVLTGQDCVSAVATDERAARWPLGQNSPLLT